MKKKILTIALTAALFLAAVALGMSTVFRVHEVALVTRFTANSGVTAEELHKELHEEYQKDGIFSVSADKAKKIVEKYPYLRVTGFEKSYPSGIKITVVEDTETYAVEAENGYYILSAEGVVVELREKANNREDNAPNLVMKGLTLTGKVGEYLTGDDAWASMLTLCRSVDEALGGIRKNAISVEVMMRSPETIFVFKMKEGVEIHVEEPSVLTKEKGEEAVNAYLSLSDEERMKGKIYVYADGGKAIAKYQ